MGYLKNAVCALYATAIFGLVHTIDLMKMEFYSVNLAVLATLNAVLVYWQQRRGKQQRQHDVVGKVEEGCEVQGNPSQSDREEVVTEFKYRYFVVYMLAIASDWLQAPYQYVVYRETIGLPQHTVAALFTVGFISGALSASFVGSLADRFGRRLACLMFCATYSISCLTLFSTSTPILYGGRALGGISTTLLFSTFETWLVAEFHSQRIEEAGGSLGDIFSAKWTLNGIIAILSGIIGQALVVWTGSKRAPFAASVCCLVIAALLMLKYWGENYGENEQTDEKIESRQSESDSTRTFGFLTDSRVLVLAAAACIFEGTTYIMVFFWSPAITSARAHAGNSGSVPFGTIFANLMSAMMLGSLGFGILMQRSKSPSSTSINLLKLVLAVASSSLLLSIINWGEVTRTLAFCLFELCVGLYYPAMGCLKESVIGDSNRGTVYSWMRLPLNIFVVLSLISTKEGETHRENMFIACSASLLVGLVLVDRWWKRSSEDDNCQHEGGQLSLSSVDEHDSISEK